VTPRLVAWLEAATVRAAGQTSVGAAVRVGHRRVTPVGGGVDVTAEVRVAAGRRVTVEVRATDDGGQLVAAGEIERVIVDRDRFLAGLGRRSG
jgi:predicted thioesterase